MEIRRGRCTFSLGGRLLPQRIASYWEQFKKAGAQKGPYAITWLIFHLFQLDSFIQFQIRLFLITLFQLRCLHEDRQGPGKGRGGRGAIEVIVQITQSWRTVVSWTQAHSIIYYLNVGMLFFAELAEATAAVFFLEGPSGFKKREVQS